MLKQILIAAGVVALMSPTGMAQSAADIAKAENGESCIDCNLFQAELAYSQIKNVTFAGSRLRQSNLTLSTMDGVSFNRTNLSIANLYGGRFTGASFKNADLSRATLVGGSFDAANFAGANLTDANISGAEMSKARGLTQEQLNAACGDEYTELPTGLSVQQCG